MFAPLTPTSFLQGPPGGGGPPGTPIMPSPAGMRPLPLQGHPCPIGNDQFFVAFGFLGSEWRGVLDFGIAFWDVPTSPCAVGCCGAQKLPPHSSQPGVELFFTVEFL